MRTDATAAYRLAIVSPFRIALLTPMSSNSPTQGAIAIIVAANVATGNQFHEGQTQLKRGGFRVLHDSRIILGE